MIRKITFVLVLVLLFSGCGKAGEPTQKALDFRTKLMQSQKCDFLADISADYGNRVYEFTVQIHYTPEETTVTVLSPEEISGIEATISEEGTRVIFDDLELDFGKMADGTVSPMSLPWLLGQCWLEEYIAGAGVDGDLEKVTYLRGYDEQELTVNTWLNKEGIPVQAEVLFDGKRCLNVGIREFQF